MKVLSFIFSFLSFSLFAQTAPEDVACKDLPAYVKASIDLVQFNSELAARLNECLNPTLVQLLEETKVE